MKYSSNTLRSEETRANRPGEVVPFQFGPFMNLFHQLFPGEMKLLEALGIHPLLSKPLKNPFNRSAGFEDFRNIGEHSIATAIAARTFSRTLVESGQLPMVEHRRIMQRALLHDAFKAYEIMYWREHGANSDLRECRAHVIQSLAKENIPSYLIAELLSAGREVGHESLRTFLRFQKREVICTRDYLPEKIVHLADSMTSSSVPVKGDKSRTCFVPVRQRLNSCGSRYPFLVNGGLALTDTGKLEDVEDVDNLLSSWKSVGSYAELQVFIGGEIAKKLCGLLIPGGIEDADEAQEFLLRLIRQDLSNS